ncbi:uncharacterized protein BDR25DRAFT_365527 [Lindgomyces ingoldianus]|uniref:Uncharacterized protein n=1 Tax=Lindgomyces ingoldianus TaxID=673940 RepID=A0ACB6RJ17_9PLEO|nr:uncharacterized protein BDR25DRAFT_365527 [Lindgomyces ingoldianus]KAF2478340.1 hypothetical protein BDR25DRAFT_365527 [Lindgomyces ingoldianus]
MGCGTFVLAGFRTLAAVVALGVVGLGAWALTIIHDVEVRGNAVLDTVLLDASKEDTWEDFFDAAVGSQMRICVAIAAGCFSFLTGTFIILSLKSQRLKVSPYLLVPLEFLCMLAMAAAFATTLTLALKLDGICSGLDISSSTDLRGFEMLCPLSKGYSIGGGVGLLLLVITSLSAIVSLCHRARNSKTCDFEPSASALGMGHDYQAVKPQAPRSTIPTIYDPFKPVPGDRKSPLLAGKSQDDDERVLTTGAAGMGRRDSELSERSRDGEEEKQISGPLGLEKPEAVKQLRPAHRPWSEMPKR